MRVRGTDKMQVGIQIQFFFESFELFRVFIRVFLRVFPLFEGLAVNFESVFVRSGIEENFVS